MRIHEYTKVNYDLNYEFTLTNKNLQIRSAQQEKLKGRVGAVYNYKQESVLSFSLINGLIKH